MSSVLIVGATRGLGYEIAKQYAQRDYKVFGTARSGPPSDAPKAIEWVSGVDVAAASAGKTIVDGLRGTKPDVTVVTAGMFPKEDFDAPDLDAELRTYATVAVGPVLVATALHRAGLLARGSKLVLVSSEAGSIGLRHESTDAKGGNYAHHASKAALNMVGKLLSLDLKDEGVAVALVHPGFMRTDMTRSVGFDKFWDQGGAVTPAQSAESLIAFVDAFDMSKTGQFWAPRGPAYVVLALCLSPSRLYRD